MFLAYLKQWLCLTLQRGDIMIDNCRGHTDPGVGRDTRKGRRDLEQDTSSRNSATTIGQQCRCHMSPFQALPRSFLIGSSPWQTPSPANPLWGLTPQWRNKGPHQNRELGYQRLFAGANECECLPNKLKVCDHSSAPSSKNTRRERFRRLSETSRFGSPSECWLHGAPSQAFMGL